jgi:hypothetical protein
VPRWAQAGADLVLGGHIHLPFVRPLHEAFPGCSRALWAVQAGTAVSSRLRRGAPNSVNLIRCPDRLSGHCGVERWDWAVASARFELADSHTLALAETPASKHAA